MVCRHKADMLEFPDGTRILASGWFERAAHELPPHFGLYLDPMWQPTWPATHLPWPDFGVPSDLEEADAAIVDAFERARSGSDVEVACIGGHDPIRRRGQLGAQALLPARGSGAVAAILDGALRGAPRAVNRLAWGLMVAGVVMMLALGWQSLGAYQSIADLNASARVETPNALFLLNDLTATGININNQIDPRLRGAYGAALQQFVLDGTGVLLGVVLLGGGVYLSLWERSTRSVG